MSMVSTTGATFFGRYATSTYETSGSGWPLAGVKSILYCRKRAEGETVRPAPQESQAAALVSVCSVAQGLQLLSGWLRFPLRVETVIFPKPRKLMRPH